MKTDRKVIDKQKILILALLLNTFVWYFLVAISIKVTYLLTFNVGIIAFVIISAYFSATKKRISFVLLSTIIGAFVPILITSVTNEVQLASMYFVLGASLGYVLPFLLGCFAEQVLIEVRGRTAGFVFFASGTSVIASILISSFFTNFVFLMVWRGIAIILLLVFLSSREDISKTEMSFGQVIKNRTFILYFVPWFIFCLNEMFNLFDISQLQYFAPTVLVGSLAALVGGRLSDLIGRKRVTIYVFILIGLGYALRGLFAVQILDYFLLFIRGFAWGILLTLFIAVLWGDLSLSSRKGEKYYAIGILPFFVFAILSLFISQQTSPLSIESYYSFLSFFIFIAILPLVYAPETLPEKTFKDRELKSYVEKAEKIVKREQKKKKNKNENVKEENDENQKEYDEAQKLAEKYY